MIKLLLFMSFAFNIIYSQNPILVNNVWYLTEVIDDNVSSVPPTNIIIGPTVLTFPVQSGQYTLSTQFCNWLFSPSVVLDDSISSFSYSQPSISLGTCPLPSLQSFENIYLGFYATNVDVQMNYIITEENDVYTLTITSPSGDKAIYNSQQLHTENLNISIISISPNPSAGLLHISEASTAVGVCQISIYNSVGQKLFSNSYNSTPKNLDISHYAKGIYYIEIDHNNHPIIKRIVKL